MVGVVAAAIAFTAGKAISTLYLVPWQKAALKDALCKKIVL
jgi:hypothetical protein